MELRQLRTFLAVAALESFNKAADRLHYAQSTVSDQIKALETDLKAKLFRQIGKKISLTEAGETLAQFARRMLDLEEEARTEIAGQGKTRGSLTVRVPETFGNYHLPAIVFDFYGVHPNVVLKFNNCSYFSLEKDLLSGVIDLAFLITDEFAAPGLETEPLAEVPLVLVARPGNPLAGRPEFDFPDLAREPFLLPTNDCSYVLMLEKAFAERRLELANVLRFNSVETIKRVVAQGTGIAVLPFLAVKDELESGLLERLAWRSGPLHANLVMIWQKNKWLPPLLREFMDMTRKHFRA